MVTLDRLYVSQERDCNVNYNAREICHNFDEILNSLDWLEKGEMKQSDRKETRLRISSQNERFSTLGQKVYSFSGSNGNLKEN